MEKRAPQVVELPAPAREIAVVDAATTLKIAETLRVQGENARATAEAVKAVNGQVRAEIDALGKKMQTVVEATAPRSKVIDVKVTARDGEGRPSSYRIVVN